MTPVDPRHVPALLAELANALQGTLGLATAMRRDSQAIADAAVALEAAVGRAVSALKRAQPRTGPGRGER